MKLAVTSLALVMAAVAGGAFAAQAAPEKPMTAQQTKMGTCSKQAHEKSLKGDEYKAYMSTCLKGNEAAKPAAMPAAANDAAPPASPVAANNSDSKARLQQRQKMKTCNAEATSKKLKGNDRQTFMSTCLKGDHTPPPATH